MRLRRKEDNYLTVFSHTLYLSDLGVLQGEVHLWVAGFGGCPEGGFESRSSPKHLCAASLYSAVLKTRAAVPGHPQPGAARPGGFLWPASCTWSFSPHAGAELWLYGRITHFFASFSNQSAAQKFGVSNALPLKASYLR